MSIAQRLLHLKRKKRLSLGDIAVCVDASRQSVDAWAKGRAIPTRENLDRLAQCLGVSKEWLEFGDGILDGEAETAMQHREMARRLLRLTLDQQVIIEMLIDEFEGQR